MGKAKPAGIGHNKGPTMEAGAGWRRFAWGKARRDLLPQMPLEVVRLRVRRAAELGLDYRAYASVRAATGRDVVALLFSSNALRVVRPQDDLPEDRADKLKSLRRTGLRSVVARPMVPGDFASRLAGAHGITLDMVAEAPDLLGTWSDARKQMLAACAGVPADAVLLIGDLGLERAWSDAGRLAGYVPAERFFAGPLRG
ncbi:MAG: hypothetical protein AAF667_07055 [Pseudomonadota bacterium]